MTILYRMYKMSRTFQFEDQILTPDFPEREFLGTCEEFAGIKFGQRKLFFALLQFLTYYCVPKNVPQGTKKYLVVYAGAAHGDNIAFASKLRPDVEFHLYDPATFNIQETEMIKIYSPNHRKSHRETEPGFFTVAEAQHWAEVQKKTRNVFFMSDVRLVDSLLDPIAQEHRIDQDMDLQWEWVRTIAPVYSQLKFRLSFPYINGIRVAEKYRRYLPGVMYFGFWTGYSSEGRLVVSAQESQEEVDWDIEKYEKNHVYYNNVYRSKISWNLQLGRGRLYDQIPGTDLKDDYDSIAEAFVWSRYLASVGNPKKGTIENIARLSNALTRNLGSRTIARLREQVRATNIPC